MWQDAFVCPLVHEHVKIERCINASIDDGITADIRQNINRIEYFLLAEVLVAVVVGAQEQC